MNPTTYAGWRASAVVGDYVAYGSPGFYAMDEATLGMKEGHVFVIQAPDDPIRVIAETPWFGGDPADGSFTQLSTEAGTTPDGIYREGASGHSEYPRPFTVDGNDRLRVTGYNTAAIIAWPARLGGAQMTAPQSTPERRRSRGLWWTLGLIGTVILVAVVAVVIWISNALKPTQEPPMQPDQVAALENDFRAKDNAEDTLSRYEQVLAQTADQITALAPGLTWRWNRDSTTISCGGDLKDTNGVQILTRHVLFDGAIPDSVWPTALDAVRDRASNLGADELFIYVDKPDDHDVAFTGGGGVEVRFGTKVAATLSARSDCHLPRADY